jgi:MFS family permease
MPDAPMDAEQSSAMRKGAFLGLVAVFTTHFASTFYVRGLVVAAPKIAADLDGMDLFAWAISLPALAAVFVVLAFSKLSDMHGRRIMITIALGFFIAGAILAAVSQSFEFNILARVIIGIGQGALAPLCFSVIGDLFPPAERSKWTGMLQIPSGITALLGPTLVGMITDSVSWRYLFWIIVPLLMISGVLVLWGVPSSAKRTAHKLDIRGTMVLGVAASTMILGFSWAGDVYAWTSYPIVALLGISVITWSIFFWIERRVEEPVLDSQVLMNRTFLTAALAGFLSFFGLISVMMYYPLFLQGVQGVSATMSGQMITPFTVIMAFVGVPTGFLLARTKRYKWMYVTGYAVLTAALFGMLLFDAATPIWLGILVTALGGLGLGAIPTLNTLVAQFAVPKRLLGVAVGAMFFFVIMGRAISPAILGSAMNVTYENTLQETLPAELEHIADQAALMSVANSRVLLSEEATAELREFIEGLESRESALFEKTVQAIRDALEASLKIIFLIAAVTTLLSFLLIVTIPEISMDAEVSDKKAPDAVQPGHSR